MAQAIQPQHLDLAEYDIRQRWRTRPPKQFPSDWASSWGFDKYGLWQTIEVPAGESGGNYGTDNKKVRHKMRFIPRGTFLMGSPEDEEERYGDETQHEVTISAGFWLGETTVTQQFWMAVTGEGPSKFKTEGDEQLPVENVSWDNCQKFCHKLSDILNVEFTLPTEAQWEYACRAGTTTAFNVGESLNKEHTNFDRNIRKTADVHKFPPNDWGLKQMHGNLWEWCLDDVRHYWSQPVTDPVGALQARAVLRGGSWPSDARFCRSAYRNYLRRDDRGSHIGLRLAQVL